MKMRLLAYRALFMALGCFVDADALAAEKKSFPPVQLATVGGVCGDGQPTTISLRLKTTGLFCSDLEVPIQGTTPLVNGLLDQARTEPEEKVGILLYVHDDVRFGDTMQVIDRLRLTEAAFIAVNLTSFKSTAQPDAQHNAGDRPPMNDSPASDTPSSPAPRG
jgi:hypothetical protein